MTPDKEPGMRTTRVINPQELPYLEQTLGCRLKRGLSREDFFSIRPNDNC